MSRSHAGICFQLGIVGDANLTTRYAIFAAGVRNNGGSIDTSSLGLMAWEALAEAGPGGMVSPFSRVRIGCPPRRRLSTYRRHQRAAGPTGEARPPSIRGYD